MSTDTTNTSEFSEGPAGAADRDPVSDATGTEPAAAAGLPTVEWMARLANEFFATLPSTSGVQGMGGPVTAGHEPARSLEGSAGERVPLEGAAEPIWPKQADVPGLLSSLPPRAQVLSEADFRDLVQSVAGATGLLRAGPESGVTTPAPVATAAGVSERGGPWGGEPSFPSPGEMFAFPGVPSGIGPPAAVGGKGVGVDSVAGMEPKSRSGLTPHIELVQQNPFTTAAVSLPSTAELFSLPGVPGAVSPPAFPLAAPAAAPPARLPGQDEIWGMTRRGQAPGTPDFLGREGERNSVQSGGVGAESGPEAVPDIGLAKRPLNPELLRRDFPILQEQVHGRRLIWLDNAATTQKPNAVIDRLSHFYRHENSNIHRAAHTLAARATDAYEGAREKARRFLNASSTQEVIFVRGTTEGINLVAQSWGRRNVGKDDEVVITWLEHHANIVPWQQLCAEKGARLRVAPVNDRGEVILEEYERLLNPRTRIVSLSHVSNALGSITPARECWWTGRRQYRTCGRTCRRSTVISMCSPDTRSSGRPASGWCTARPTCWKPCLRGRAAAT